jgi:hypothetical protein
MIALSTLHELRQHLGFSTATSSDDDDRLLSALASATALIERFASRDLLPRIVSHSVTISTSDAASVAPLWDLLEVLTLTDGAETLLPADLETTPDGRLLRSDQRDFCGDERGQVQIHALWGYHPQPAEAWQPVTTLSASLASGSTTLTCSATGTSAAPLFSAGQLLRIGDELLAVLAVNFQTNSLSVTRALRGSSAAAHNSAAPILRYAVPADLTRLCLRFAHWMLREADDPAAEFPAHLLSASRLFQRIRV